MGQLSCQRTEDLKRLSTPPCKMTDGSRERGRKGGINRHDVGVISGGYLEVAV